MAKNRIVFSNDFILKDERVGINTSSPKATLDVAGDIYSSGITTSLGGFFGDVVGNVTGISSIATKLENPRTFQITGDVVASPISFDGTGNVSLAATIQPNSVGLGTDTFGDYTKNISGTTNEIVVTGGTGEGSTPVISFAPNPLIGGNVTIGNDLQVNNNLNVTGNITVGGTTGYILVNEFRVTDADIVLGFATDISGNDVSNDTTANHGGIAVASTEGNPLITLTNPGVGETLPATYKKIMWFKAGSFAGLNTDAWLSNYAIGIGSTQFPSGTRLAAGSVQITENDLAVVRNINASGISTFNSVEIGGALYDSNSATGSSSQFLVSTGTGVSWTTSTTSAAGQDIIIATGTDPYYLVASNITSGVSTAGFVDAQVVINNGNFGVGTTTPTSKLTVNGGFNVTGISTFSSNLDINSSVDISNNLNVSGVSTFNSVIVGSAVTINSSGVIAAGIVTANEYYGVFKGTIDSGVTLDRANYADVAGIATYAIIAGYSTTSGISTTSQGLTGTPNIVVGVITATDFNTTSDSKLKTNVQVISDPLEKVLQISGVSFNWISDNKPSMGVLADEVQKILPELVSDTDPKTVNYNGLIGLLIECVKDLLNEVEDLKKRIR